jgi:glucose/arabinose dehydrogenase
MRAMTIVVVALVAVSLSGWQAPPDPAKLAAPFATPSANNRPQVVDRPAGAELHVPSGFQVEEYLSGFEKPRYMITGPSGEILLSDSADQGCVYVLQGKSRKKILEGLFRPFGLAVWKDYLYVSEANSLKRYKYDKAAMTASGGEEIYSMKNFSEGHWTRTITFDAKGEKLYLGIGSQSNVDAGEDPARAAIHVMNPDGTGRQTYASGTRNPTAIHFHPATGVLWAAVQERDQLGADLVPDYFTAVKQGGFYGWPYAYVGPHEDPRRKGEAPDLVKKTIVPDYLLGSHVAVIDWAFYTGKQFPDEYQGGVFFALHGSWNRSERVGYSVVFLPMKDGKITGSQKDFLTGFMTDPTKTQVWGRPVAVYQMADGSLLVSDDGGNKIWRIYYKG